jgi:radical SAM protein with 4Fe4S-binding SPASM domain
MNCIHCGSDCNCISKGKELSTNECLEVIEDLSDLKSKLLIFSGGEPLLREDLGTLISACHIQNVPVAIISNAYLVNEETIKKIKAFNLLAYGISIDAAEPLLQDYIRGKKNSFEHVKRAIKLLNENNIPPSIVTTIHKLNYTQLPKIRDFLLENNVRMWQIQYGDNIGRLPKEWKITEAQYCKVARFIYDTQRAYPKEKLFVSGVDVFGYMSKLSKAIQGAWCGCVGGIRAVGISANGDVRACLSLQEDKYIEGNVRESSFKQIWMDKTKFQANRRFDCSMLTGYCATCKYAAICRGGCYRAATLNGGRCNPYCLYRFEKEGFSSEYQKRTNFTKQELFDMYNPIREMPKEYLQGEI